MRKKNRRVLHKAPQSNTAWFDSSLVKSGIKKLPMIFGIAVVLYVAVLIKDYDAPAVLPVENVMVEGELIFLGKNDIMQIVKDNVKEGYITVDLKQLREILLQQPWIKNVSLRRKWPASVVVLVEEHKPLAFWNSDAYISDTGDVFKPLVIDNALNLPHLNGPDTQHNNVLKFMNTLYKQMAALNYDVKRLELDDRRAWQMVIENTESVSVADASIDGADIKKIINKINVKLGRFETEKRLQRFIRVLPALSAQTENTENKIEVIDMRYPNGFAVEMSTRAVARVTGLNNATATNGRIQNVMHIAVRSNAYDTAQFIQNDIKNYNTHYVTQSFVYAHRYATVSMGGA
jgi:cell division protein FtsQ